MIRLVDESKSKNNVNGDIEIITTGLRPGEKLYEELLIEGELLKTPILLFLERVKKRFLIKNLRCYSVFRDAITNLDEARLWMFYQSLFLNGKKIIKKNYLIFLH